MSTVQATKATERDVHSVTPHLVCDGADAAIDFYKDAFGAVEMIRLPGPNGKLVHACVSICDSPVMLVDENADCGMVGPKTLGGTPVIMHLAVEDVDGFIERAEKAGAKIIMPAADMFWGDRYGLIEDPLGHRWSIATHQRDMTPDEIQEAMKQAIPDYAKG